MGCSGGVPRPPEPEDPAERKVFCVKFQKELPGLKEAMATLGGAGPDGE